MEKRRERQNEKTGEGSVLLFQEIAAERQKRSFLFYLSRERNMKIRGHGRVTSPTNKPMDKGEKKRKK